MFPGGILHCDDFFQYSDFNCPFPAYCIFFLPDFILMSERLPVRLHRGCCSLCSFHEGARFSNQERVSIYPSWKNAP